MNQIARPLHAAFKDIGNAKLLAHLAQVVRRAFVFLGGGSRDHFQISDFCEVSQDLVLDPIGKERESSYLH